MKKFNPNRKTANQGVAFVQGVVDEMGCVWRPTPNDDVGLDGEIELGKDGAATGLLLKVQVKSGPSYFLNSTGSNFEFLASPDDLHYWSESNIPVILVIYDPERKEGYWKSIKEYLAANPGSIAKARRIPFSRKRDRFVVATFLQLCNLVFTDEAELTNFLKNKITEPIYSNLLFVVDYPETLYRFQLSESRLAEMDLNDPVIPRDFVPHGNDYIGFRDPRQPGSKIASAIISNTIEQERSSQYLENPQTRSKIVGIWNHHLFNYLLGLGLSERDWHRVYFPPDAGDKSREIQWESPHRRPTRKVAYPYVGKQSQKTVFWVHHSLRTRFRNVGDEWFLILEPGYVFTRDGYSFIQANDAGALSTSRMSQERNYQVINHLYFWAWFLRNGDKDIRIPCGAQNLVVDAGLANGVANFGIGTDKKTLSTILNSDYDLNWSDLEEDTKTASEVSEEDE
jgi:hypothetical protein